MATPYSVSSHQGAYFAASPNKDLKSKRAIVFLTDGLADNLATKFECDVWVPDDNNGVCWHFHPDTYSAEPTFLTGRPLIPLDTMTLDRAGEKWSIWQWIKFVAVIGIPNLPAIFSSRPSVVDVLRLLPSPDNLAHASGKPDNAPQTLIDIDVSTESSIAEEKPVEGLGGPSARRTRLHLD
ncbi:hypothetical protein K443DRAFT_12573 [Laccaria amethystina LaAM-08-1]|uniref:Uncharacterized protein n=1 Tax=Laccaria amethystina LaAM-08-1 TaxID=1095629 RepID=A0A0C9WJ05_9AGAR|nr:hypothetical protein K443DRAFT_12573 [Laccaria amethystina LaAM-08-1]